MWDCFDETKTASPHQKKKPSAVAGKVSSCFGACSWSQGPKRNVVTVAQTRGRRVFRLEPRSRRGEVFRSYFFLVVFLVVFLDDFLAAFFLPWRLVTSFLMREFT